MRHTRPHAPRPALVPFLLALAATAPALPAQLGLQLTNGVDGGIEVPADPRLVPPTGITVEAWVTYDDASIPTGTFRWPTIVRQNIQNASEVYFFRVGAGTTASRTLQWKVRAGTQQSTASYSFAPGEFAQFTHLAATFDGQVLRIYKNGVQVATSSLATPAELVYAGDVLRIGNGDAVNPGNETWNGVLDEVRIWPVARTAGEIQSTMNQSISGYFGKALMFPLDGHTLDVSSALFGNQFGTSTFVPGATLPPLQFLPTAPVGQSTTTCGRSIDALIASMPQIGNASFAVWAARGPRPATSQLAVVVGSLNQAPLGLPPFLGVDVAIDPLSVVYQATLIPPTNALGNARLPLPLPMDPSLPGVSVVFQFAFADATCGPQGLTGSDGIQFSIL
ncbi:MAG: LamG domain-containing protein [Planctomycetota bacterium]